MPVARGRGQELSSWPFFMFIFKIMEVKRMRNYNPDVFELEEKYQEKNPEWYKQYVDEDADAVEETVTEEAYPVMSAKDADDGREYIPWDNTPVMPSRKGFYDDYSCYFNEYRKIPQAEICL